MKHTFWYIDKIHELLEDEVARTKLETPKQKKQAREILEKIVEYDKQLRKLIDAHKTKEHMATLRESHADSIVDWEKRVDVQFQKLDDLLDVLDKDIPELIHILEQEPEKWGNAIGNMSLGFFYNGFMHAEHNMKEFRELAVFRREHLQEILDDMEDIEHLLE